MRDERKSTVGAVLGGQLNEFMYRCDVGDGWNHRAMVEKQLPIEDGRDVRSICLWNQLGQHDDPKSCADLAGIGRPEGRRCDAGSFLRRRLRAIKPSSRWP